MFSYLCHTAFWRMKRNKTNNKPPKQNDELLKGVFEEWFVEFLRFLYPNAGDLFDFSRGLTMMDKELLSVIPDRERKKGKAKEASAGPLNTGTRVSAPVSNSDTSLIRFSITAKPSC